MSTHATFPNGEVIWAWSTHPDGGVRVTVAGVEGRPELHVTERDLTRMHEAVALMELLASKDGA